MLFLTDPVAIAAVSPQIVRKVSACAARRGVQPVRNGVQVVVEQVRVAVEVVERVVGVPAARETTPRRDQWPTLLPTRL
ncbi:MAG: hypothetical protein J2P17_19845 [Mycobacterium sp.]|nr:hypothetical protein [Mycobacterium sp.]